VSWSAGHECVSSVLKAPLACASTTAAAATRGSADGPGVSASPRQSTDGASRQHAGCRVQTTQPTAVVDRPTGRQWTYRPIAYPLHIRSDHVAAVVYIWRSRVLLLHSIPPAKLLTLTWVYLYVLYSSILYNNYNGLGTCRAQCKMLTLDNVHGTFTHMHCRPINHLQFAMVGLQTVFVTFGCTVVCHKADKACSIWASPALSGVVLSRLGSTRYSKCSAASS